ncbi:MAG TPA: hypothetical protein VGO40_05200 [Longimicrobium sp.]|jgi:hypothetical protein|nr:hypothetical protein [Longimicrobium sp.]
MEIDDRPATSTADNLPFDWRSTPLGQPDWNSSDLSMTSDMRSREFARIRAEHSDWIRLEVVREWIRLCFLPEPMPAWLDARFREDIAAERALMQN